MTIWTEIANIASDSGDAGLAQLKNLLAGLSASDSNAGEDTRYLLYSGYTTPDTSGTSFRNVIKDITAESGGKLTSIFNTEIGQVLDDDDGITIRDAIVRITGNGDGNYLDRVIYGAFDTSTGVCTHIGLWDDASRMLIEHNTHFEVMAPHALNGTTFEAVELPTLLQKTGDFTVNGTGNTLNNTLIGNSGNNRLEGGAGNDPHWQLVA